MTSYSREDLSWTSDLKEALDGDVELQDEQGHALRMELEAEFKVGEQRYAVLRRPGAAAGEHELYHVSSSTDGEISITTIEDDDEWEDISELYDECTLPEEL
ncbi:DUF1292 domain-containing protein [Paenibacillus polymyxa]|uniref:DUF1292 domain-containing protein n=1 Tax=Paenibacillus polymyxa TaxID=1406 RepID=UPI0008AF1DC6|nr:DUF1292 domain-containing protein [Paenibacillus polymyxa]SEJ62912.1 Protein of unknown function [Paenibacillus polymyxa]